MEATGCHSNLQAKNYWGEQSHGSRDLPILPGSSSLLEELNSPHFSSVAQSYLTLCDPIDCSTPDLPVHHQLLELTKLMSIESVMPSNHLILWGPRLLPPSIIPSIRVFSNESVLHIRWPKYWSFSFSIKSFQWIFRTDLLAVQGTLKSLLQQHSSKASILLCSAFFIVQLSHPYMTTRKTKALTRCSFVGKCNRG